MPYLRILRLWFGSNSNLRFRFDVLCPSFPAIHISKQQRRRWHEKRQNYEMKCIVGIGFGGVFCRLWHVTNTRLQLSVIAGLSRNMCPWIVVCVHITHTHTRICVIGVWQCMQSTHRQHTHVAACWCPSIMRQSTAHAHTEKSQSTKNNRCNYSANKFKLALTQSSQHKMKKKSGENIMTKPKYVENEWIILRQFTLLCQPQSHCLTPRAVSYVQSSETKLLSMLWSSVAITIVVHRHCVPMHNCKST